MSRALRFYRSTVGKKVIMAVTGLTWVGYVILHLSGNLLAFAGREKINAYSAFLHGPGVELLWLARAILIVSLVLHVWLAWQTSRLAAAARPDGYKQRDPQVSTWASRTMRWGGVLLLAFIVFHLLHLTTRDVDPAGWAQRHDAAGRYDIYGNMVASFRIWWVSAIYIGALLILGFHLWHGLWSSPRSVGIAKQSVRPLDRCVAPVLTAIIVVGFVVIPIAIMAGWIR